MKPKLIDRLLHVSGWDMSQTKNSKYSSDKFFPKMVSVILGSSYHAGVCSRVTFSDKSGFNEIFEAMKMGCNVIIDSCTQLVIGSNRCIGGNSRAWRQL